MRFQRHAKILRGPLDPAPVAAVFFLLVIFLLLNSLLHTPGILLQIDLPSGDGLMGTSNPQVIVAVNFQGQVFFEGQIVQENELKAKLKERLQAAARDSKDLEMVLWADKATQNQVETRLCHVAREAGVKYVLLAERPGALSGPKFSKP